MQGYVLTFRPATGDGTIITESGKAIRFASPSCRTELRGGDIVTFQVDSAEGPIASLADIKLVQRWAARERPADQHLLREFCATLEVNEVVH